MRSPTRMVGRIGEQRQLATFVSAATGQALVLRGQSGVGKSALLDHAAGLAMRDDHQVIRAAGVEAESGLPFAGLHQVLHPLLFHLDGLDPAHRAMFDTVFGSGGGEAPSLMSLGIAVLDLLAHAASAKPLLVILDDGQWLDASSVTVCGFVGRRLTDSSVKLLVGLRSDIASGFDTAALPELTVRPLHDEAAEELLDLRHPGLRTHVRRVVLDQAAGNPLALLEMPQYVRLSDLGRLTDGGLGLGDTPLPRRLQHVYGTRVEDLGDGVREELLRGALDGVGAGTSSGRGSRRYRMHDVDEAVAAGLLEIDPVSGDFVFRHPLVRSTVVQMATPNQRRAAHTALARVHRDDLERCATHLAAAAVDPDEAVAATLESAAESAVRRGGAMAAMTWLTRAAELSEDHENRSRRLGDAAFIAGHAGFLDQAQQLTPSEAAPGAHESPASVLTASSVALFEEGNVRGAHRQVVAAIERLSETEGQDGASEVLVRLVNLLLAIDQYAGDRGQWEETRALMGTLGHLVPPRSLIYGDAWSDVVRHGAGVSERLRSEFTRLADMDPWDVTRLAVAAYHMDLLNEYRPHLQRTVDREAETGFVRNGMTMLHLIMLAEMTVGEWEAAERTGQRALELTTSHGYALLMHHSQAYLALLAALRGQPDRARELQARVESWARPRGVGFLTQITAAVATTTALSEGDHEAAYRHAIGITPPGAFAPYAHQASRTLLDLVEAAVHTGRSESARRHALAAQEARLPSISPRLALLTYGALAMTAADDTEAEEMYHRAEAHPAGANFPFELARIHFAHGIRLRHAQRLKEARRLLVSAAETFERLGAPAWEARARAELRASGVATRGTTPVSAELTWQERQVAELAALGLTNKEIGERMRLSPRTISSHLYRIFPKLGITSRAALRDALARLDQDT